jgi:hypothetical protein
MTIELEETLMEAFKNAAERGETPEKIRDSFLNAGYDAEKVNAVFDKIQGSLPANEEVLDEKIQKEIPEDNLQINQPRVIVPLKVKKRSSLTTIIIILFLAVLAVAGGFLIWLYKDSILKFLS